MANGITRARSGGVPVAGTRHGDWMWDGSNWVCDPDCNGDSGFPPFGPPVFSGPTAQPPWYPGANGGVSFGATAPPNPVRGHMWWDGIMFRLFDGAAWVDIGPGAAATAGTTEPVFAVQNITLAAITASTWTIAPINGTPTLNTAGVWNASTHQFTPNKPGIYFFQFLAWNPDTIFLLSLTKNDNGGPYAELDKMPTVGAAEVTQAGWIFGNAMAQANGTTDFFRLWVWSAGGHFDQSYGLPALSAFLLP